MARGSSTNKTATGRSKITSQSQDVITDNGNALFSVVHGEQIQVEITLSWITNLSGATITPKIVEGENDGQGTKPTAAASNPQVTTLSVIDDDVTDNKFKIVFPETLINSWGQSPRPGKPVYGFFGLEVADGGTGANQQRWKPLRGMVEVLYSPTEVA